jgi:hypothetical protein
MYTPCWLGAKQLRISCPVGFTPGPIQIFPVAATGPMAYVHIADVDHRSRSVEADSISRRMFTRSGCRPSVLAYP